MNVKPTKQQLAAIKEQFPEMLYLFERASKRLTAQEESYRAFLRKEVLKKLVLE